MMAPTGLQRYVPYSLNRQFLGDRKLKVRRVANEREDERDLSFWEAARELLDGDSPELDDTWTYSGLPILKGDLRYEIVGSDYLKDLVKLLVEKVNIENATWYFVERTWSRYETSAGYRWHFFLNYQGRIVCEDASLYMDRNEDLPSELFIDQTNRDEDYSSDPPMRVEMLAWARSSYRDFYNNTPKGRHVALREQTQAEIHEFGGLNEGLDFAPESTHQLLLRAIVLRLRDVRTLLFVIALMLFVALLKYLFG